MRNSKAKESSKQNNKRPLLTEHPSPLLHTTHLCFPLSFAQLSLQHGTPRERESSPLCSLFSTIASLRVGSSERKYLDAHNSSAEAEPPADKRLCTTLFHFRYGQTIRFLYTFCCRVLSLSSGAGIVRGSVGGACINNFTFYLKNLRQHTTLSSPP